VLLEFGAEEMEEDMNVAEFVVNELDEYQFEDPVFQQIFDIYEDHAEAGDVPKLHNLKHHEKEDIQQKVIELLSLHHDVSDNWSRMHDIFIEDKSVIYKMDVKSSVCRLLLKKIRKEIETNRRELEKNESDEKMTKLLVVRKQLKEMELTLTKQLNTVIY
jgi:DNA primase